MVSLDVSLDYFNKLFYQDISQGYFEGFQGSFKEVFKQKNEMFQLEFRKKSKNNEVTCKFNKFQLNFDNFKDLNLINY